LKDDSNITFGTIRAILNDAETDIIVIEYEKGVFTEYWIKLGGLINAIHRPDNAVTIGVGAKKFSKEIRDVVSRYQLAKMDKENSEYVESALSFH